MRRRLSWLTCVTRWFDKKKTTHQFVRELVLKYWESTSMLNKDIKIVRTCKIPPIACSHSPYSNRIIFRHLRPTQNICSRNSVMTWVFLADVYLSKIRIHLSYCYVTVMLYKADFAFSTLNLTVSYYFTIAAVLGESTTGVVYTITADTCMHPYMCRANKTVRRLQRGSLTKEMSY